MRDNIYRAAFVLAECVLLVASLASCQRGGAPSASNSGTGLERFYPDAPRVGNGSGYAKVTFAPYVHQLTKSEGLGGLVAESSNGHGLIFKASTPQIGSLKDGDILMIKGVAARKVLGVDRQGDEVLVVVDRADIRDVVQEGTIHIEAPVRFGTAHAASLPTPWFRLNPLDFFDSPVYAQGSFSPENNAAAKASSHAATGASIDAFGNMAKGAAKYALGDWTISEWSATPNGSQLNLALVMSKTDGGFKALVQAHGYLQGFDMMQNATLGPNGGATQWVSSFSSLGGQMKFQWEIGKDSPGGYAKEDRISLPAGISVPLAQYVGGIPLVLGISSALIVHPAITGASQLAAGAYTINFGGSMAANGGDGGVSGSGDASSTAHLDQDQGVSALGPIAMVIAFCAPRIEISLGLTKIFPVLNSAASAPGGLLDRADKWLDSFAQKHLSAQAYQALSASPLGTAVFSNILKSNAAAYAQIITSVGASRTGTMVLAPCSRVDLKVVGQVGFNASVFGMKFDEDKYHKDVFDKSWTDYTGGLCAGGGK
jgi:hypothetical protein